VSEQLTEDPANRQDVGVVDDERAQPVAEDAEAGVSAVNTFHGRTGASPPQPLASLLGDYLDPFGASTRA